MATIPPPDDDRWRLADAIERVVALREAIADGRLDEAEAIAERVELDLVAGCS
jgi:hypothetical protein